MPQFRIVIRTDDVYEKFVEAETIEEATAIIDGESNWGDSATGWERLDGSSYIDFVEVKP